MPPETPAAASGTGERWRDEVTAFLAEPRFEDPAPAQRRTALALQFELRELTPRTTYRWNGPTSRAVTATTHSPGEEGEVRLGVRPVTRTSRGWARGTLTWTNLPHQLNRLELDPRQHRWFSEFGALHRAAGPGLDSDWIFLDEFANPVLWSLLDQARELDIPLVASTPGTEVRRGVAILRLDAARTDDGIRVEPLLLVDGAATELVTARAIGTHGIYVYQLGKPQRLLIAPVDPPLGQAALTLLSGSRTASRPLRIPSSAADEFLSDYLPELRDRIEVGSADASVPIPAAAAPTLVVTASFSARHTLELDWRWDVRRASAEVLALSSLLPAGLLPDEWMHDGDQPRTLPPAALLRGIDAAEFAAGALPRLETLPGVRVERRGKAPDYRELTGTPHLTVTTVPTDKDDWFDLGVVVTVDGREVPFVPLFKALASGRKKLLLVDGRYMALTHPAFAPLAELIHEAKNLAEWDTVPRISRHQTALWADFEDLADESHPALEWRELLADVRGDAPRTVPAPAGLRAELRPYQAEGFSWLAFLWRHRLGAILADDMGLGKTLQCLALIQHAIEGRKADDARPFLVVAPTSVVGNWATEAARFSPDLVVRTIGTTEGKNRQSLAVLAAGADIVITSYALLRLDFAAYQSVATSTGWAGLILDEAQFVKNATSQVHESARDLDVQFKLAVTGTPMENSLTELHALFAIVAPGLFASARRFTEEYVRPIEQLPTGITRGRGAGTAPETSAAARQAKLARLRQRVKPFLLRRTKELVASELPAKQEQTLTIDLAPEHRALYDVHLQRERQKLFGLLEDLDRNRFIVFRSLTLLRLLALDASLIDPEYAGVASSKLDALFEQLDDVVAEGHRALIFSQFTRYLGLAASRLEAAGIPYVYLDGSTRNRPEVIAEFKDGQAPVFLISLKAGGFGLNLTEADYVFLLDPWWNPATEEQAIDRTHRIGQTRNVMVYRLIAADTIEEKVMKLKERKAALFDAVIDDEDLFSSSLSADDIRGLLA